MASSSPYDVLRAFSETVTGSYDAEELPARMARVLADGTGAEWAQVWLVVGGEPAAGGHLAPGRRVSDRGPTTRRDAVPARCGSGELLGELVVQEREHRPLSSVEARLFAGLADQAGPVLRGARLHAELSQRLASSRRGPRSCARRASAWSRPRTPSAGSSSATSTTAPSSTSSPSR